MVAIPAMRELPSRTYRSDTDWRRRWGVPDSISHPAKMNAWLCRDLFLRYTLPGQVVLDPFLGIGTTLLGMQLGRNVVGVELEPKFAALARRNAARIRGGLLGVEAGWALVLQGDSRRLPLRSADGVVTSPPFGAMNAPDCGGTIKARPAKDGRGFVGERGDWLYSEATAGQIGNLPLGDVSVVLSSPPYGDVASRDRSEEPYSQRMDLELRRKWGTGDTNRHIDGYGETPGNIGNLPHAVLTSPPYENSIDEAPRLASIQKAIAEGRASPALVERFSSFGSKYLEQAGPGFLAGGYGGSAGQIGKEQGGTYAAACLAVYRECYRVVRPGGVLGLVTGNYVRDGRVLDLAADTVRLCVAAGWTPVERWRHEKANVSFWRRLHHQQGRPVVTHEDVLVFAKGYQGWAFAELAPTTLAPAVLSADRARPAAAQLGLFDEGEVAGGVKAQQLSLFYQGAVSPSSDWCQRWRDGRHHWRHRSEGGFDSRQYEVASIAEAEARRFVVQHHYLATYPAARLRYGLYDRGGALVGVAVLSVPSRAAVLSGTFPTLIPYRESLELGRFILLDAVPANAESWFWARCRELAAREGLGGVVAFSDPVPRQASDGEIVFPGHVGTVYQASNAVYLGRSTPRTQTLLPDGSVFSDRAASKVRRGERGHSYAERQLERCGARPRRPGEDGAAWLREASAAVGARKVRHPGNHRYAFRLGSRDGRIEWTGVALPYPKQVEVAGG